MKGRILILLFLFFNLAASAQFRMIGTSAWVVVDDSTYQGTVYFQTDLTGKGYLATSVVDTFRVFTGTEQIYNITTVGSTTFSSAQITVREYNGDHGMPIGQVMVYDPAGKLTLPQAPFGSTGSTAQIQAAIDTYNARLLGSAGVDLTSYSTTTQMRNEISDSIATVTGLADGDKGDITVSGSGGTWTIDANTIDATNISTNAVGADELAPTGVTATSYTAANITVDQDGRITSATGNTTLVNRAELTDTSAAIRADIPDVSLLAPISALNDTSLAIRADIPASQNLFSTFTDVLFFSPVVADNPNDTLTFRSPNSTISFSAWNDDATYGDYLAFDLASNAVSWSNLKVAVQDSIQLVRGDNLGNHTATQNIQLDTFWLSADGGDEGISIGPTGHVGINTEAPLSTFSIQENGGYLNVNNLITANYMALGFHGSTLTTTDYALMGGRIDPTTYINRPSGGAIKFKEANGVSPQMTIAAGGNVGIGDETPDALLDVAGTFRLDGTFTDNIGSIGTDGQVLTSNGVDSILWKDATALPTFNDQEIPFSDASGDLEADAAFLFDNTSNTMTIGTDQGVDAVLQTYYSGAASHIGRSRQTGNRLDLASLSDVQTTKNTVPIIQFVRTQYDETGSDYGSYADTTAVGDIVGLIAFQGYNTLDVDKWPISISTVVTETSATNMHGKFGIYASGGGSSPPFANNDNLAIALFNSSDKSVTMQAIKNTVDSSSAVTPLNFLYTDANGQLLSGDISRDRVSDEETTTVTAVAGVINLVNVASGSATVTPPSTPESGTWFAVSDSRGNASTNNITVDLSTDKYHTDAVDYTMNTDNAFARFTYVDSTVGWIRSF